MKNNFLKYITTKYFCQNSLWLLGFGLLSITMQLGFAETNKVEDLEIIANSFICEKKLPTLTANAKLSLVQNAYAKLKSFNGNFTQNSYLAALEIDEKSSGNVWFSKPGNMRWEYKLPDEQTFLIKDKTLWLYQPLDNQVIVEDFAEYALSDLPLAFIMGLGDLTKDFKALKICENKMGYLFELVPVNKLTNSNKNESEGIKSFYLLVNARSYLPIGAEVLDLSENKNSVIFHHIKYNSPIREENFNFEYPDGVDVSDQRGD